MCCCNHKSVDLSLIADVLDKYAAVKGSLITILQKTQDIYGYIPTDACGIGKITALRLRAIPESPLRFFEIQGWPREPPLRGGGGDGPEKYRYADFIHSIAELCGKRWKNGE